MHILQNWNGNALQVMWHTQRVTWQVVACVDRGGDWNNNNKYYKRLKKSINYSDIRLEKAEKCSCMSTPPSRTESEELPWAEANIKLKIMEKSQTQGRNGEKRPLLKWCSCGNKPAKTQNIHWHASWTDLTPAEKIRLVFFLLYYITEWTCRNFCDCV